MRPESSVAVWFYPAAPGKPFSSRRGRAPDPERERQDRFRPRPQKRRCMPAGTAGARTERSRPIRHPEQMYESLQPYSTRSVRRTLPRFADCRAGEIAGSRVSSPRCVVYASTAPARVPGTQVEAETPSSLSPVERQSPCASRTDSCEVETEHLDHPLALRHHRLLVQVGL